MRWNSNQTDLDARDAQLISEQLRHERLDRQNSIISPIETTPAGEPLPVRTMAQHREDQLQQQAKSILDVMGNEPDEIPDL